MDVRVRESMSYKCGYPKIRSTHLHDCVPLRVIAYLVLGIYCFSECSVTGDEPGGANLGIQVPLGYHGHVIRSLMV